MRRALTLAALFILGCGGGKREDPGYNLSEYPGQGTFTAMIDADEDLEMGKNDPDWRSPSSDDDVTITCRGREIIVTKYEGTPLVFRDGELDSLSYRGTSLNLRSTGMGFYFSGGGLSMIDAFDPETGTQFSILVTGLAPQSP